VNEHQEYVLSEIIKETGDVDSTGFWMKALKELGANAVAEDLGELKLQRRRERKKNPAAYLTSLLTERMKLKGKSAKKGKIKTHFETSPDDMIRHLAMKDPKELSAQIEIGQMIMPYNKKQIPWPTFIGPEYFTLSTNKKKSDSVPVEVRSLQGGKIKATLLRGKWKPGDIARGILTVLHMKVFAALELAWVNAGSNWSRHVDGTIICKLKISARELAKLLGWKKFGGWHLNQLIRCIGDLAATPYYLYETNGKKHNGAGYTLLGDMFLLNQKDNGGERTVYSISFSSTISWQLVERHVVSRSKNMLALRSELANLILLYIEPMLRKYMKFERNLLNLVKELNLPEAHWHELKAHRKRQFGKAIKDLDGFIFFDDVKLKCEITQGKEDWKLSARLLYPLEKLT